MTAAPRKHREDPGNIAYRQLMRNIRSKRLPYNQARHDARTRILQAANRHLLQAHTRRAIRPAEGVRILSMRHIGEAVHIARHHHLATAAVLEVAGYRTENPR